MQRQRFEVELHYHEDEATIFQRLPAADDLGRWLLERLVAEAYYTRPERVEVREHGTAHPSEKLRARLYRIASAAASGSEDPRPLIEALASDLARQTTAHPSEEDLHP